MKIELGISIAFSYILSPYRTGSSPTFHFKTALHIYIALMQGRFWRDTITHLLYKNLSKAYRLRQYYESKVTGFSTIHGSLQIDYFDKNSYRISQPHSTRFF